MLNRLQKHSEAKDPWEKEDPYMRTAGAPELTQYQAAEIIRESKVHIERDRAKLAKIGNIARVLSIDRKKYPIQAPSHPVSTVGYRGLPPRHPVADEGYRLRRAS